MPHYVIHYKEIGIKGGNRVVFERRLIESIREGLAGGGAAGGNDVAGSARAGTDTGAGGSGGSGVRLHRFHGRILLEAGTVAPTRVEERLSCLPGIAHFAPAEVVDLDLEAMKAAALRFATGVAARSFRIDTRRSNKAFPMTSVEVNRAVGAVVAGATGMKVDLERAEHTVWIEITRQEAIVYSRRLPGIGGLPLGISGGVVVLLSGGIDSPVAAFKMIRRGCTAILLHFHNYTRSAEQVRSKVLDLARVLARFQLRSRLWLVPFDEVQAAILTAVPPAQRMVTYRRVMLQMGETVLEREGAKAFITGDSVGQVASQTLDNIQAIYAAARHPVLTPLIGDDKEEIVGLARRIGTYEVSIRPYEDCCSFLVARHPDTAVRLDRLEVKEARIPLAEIAKKALDAAEVVDVDVET